ncbi:MAG: hypothetical protein NT158_06430 [Cyanobacteria bacterium]|nr:hypothetical protein [Cyanobacteriota bacterium]
MIDGPEAAPATVLLAHGAGSPMDSPFMAAIASGLAQSLWRVVRFEFPYMARMRETGRRQGPDRMPVLQEAFCAQVQLEKAANPDRLLFIGGKSMGGRVRTEHLAALQTPTLILQGERDGFGKRGEVEGYALSPQVQLRWITSFDGADSVTLTINEVNTGRNSPHRFRLALVTVTGNQAAAPVYVSGIDWGLPGFGDTQITKNLQQLQAAGPPPQ